MSGVYLTCNKMSGVYLTCNRMSGVYLIVLCFFICNPSFSH